jgi:ubiquinone/menaquinone biosynthesis C-methylase UbiE
MIDYDRFASEYARRRTIHPRVLESLVSIGRINRGSAVLEVGCGTGNYIAAIRADRIAHRPRRVGFADG